MKFRVDALSSAAIASLALLTVALGGSALAQDKPDVIRIFSHPVHERVATGNQGGDITAKWQSETGIAVEWNTLDVAPLGDRLFREMTLPETSVSPRRRSRRECWRRRAGSRRAPRLPADRPA